MSNPGDEPIFLGFWFWFLYRFGKGYCLFNCGQVGELGRCTLENCNSKNDKWFAHLTLHLHSCWFPLPRCAAMRCQCVTFAANQRQTADDEVVGGGGSGGACVLRRWWFRWPDCLGCTYSHENVIKTCVFTSCKSCQAVASSAKYLPCTHKKNLHNFQHYPNKL